MQQEMCASGRVPRAEGIRWFTRAVHGIGGRVSIGRRLKRSETCQLDKVGDGILAPRKGVKVCGSGSTHMIRPRPWASYVLHTPHGHCGLMRGARDKMMLRN